MTITLFLLAVGLGVAFGLKFGAVLPELQGASERRRRAQALKDAEDCIREVQTAALYRLADAATQVVDVQTNGRALAWPSERAGHVPDVRGDR